MMETQVSDIDDGVVYISQHKLIALQNDVRLIKKRHGLSVATQSGAYLSRFKGRGMEFDEARPYQPGDDVRNIDWRVTARTNKPHSKVFREERERPVLLWVDLRPTMFFGTRECFKSVKAAQLAALIGWKSAQHSDRLGGLIFSAQQHLEIRPSLGRKSALHLIQQLSQMSRQFPQQYGDYSAELTHALLRLQKVTRPGSRLHLISDFRNLTDSFESTVTRLSRHNELELIHVVDPLEQQLPDGGVYRVTDGSHETEIDSSDRRSVDQYQQRFNSHQLWLKNLCSKLGARYQMLATDQPLMQAVNGRA